MSENNSKNYTQSENYSQYMKTIGWEVITFQSKYFIYIKKLNFLNLSIVKIPRAETNINYAEIDKISKKHHALLIKIEPDEKNSEQFNKNKQKLLKLGFCRDNFPILQTKTIIVDLKLSNDQLLASLRSETRHHLRKSWKQNFHTKIIINNQSLESEKAINDFYALFENCAKERKFYTPFKTQMQTLWNCFREKATIILVYEKDNQKPLSGALILTHGNTAYYKYGASIPYGRNKYSSYFLFWEMFKWAKKSGFKNFDLEGIYDERYHRTQKYVGFTQFKKGWSKNEVTYLGSFTKYYSLPLKLLAKIGI